MPTEKANVKKPCAVVFTLTIFALTIIGCGQLLTSTESPLFTDPVVKLAELESQAFTVKLFSEAVSLEAQLIRSGARVHFGFWSRSPHRDNLIVLLDAINSYVSSEVYRAIWDEGTTTASTKQYPSYVTMNREYWYERANAVGGKVTINGVTYTDPHPVTFAQADQIWGAYSKRYTDTARLIRQATGITIESWCFVEGARATRIFYTFELPELISLEATGDVYVHFAKSSSSSWQDHTQWITGTTNAPTGEP
jgi:hypothetical protein